MKRRFLLFMLCAICTLMAMAQVPVKRDNKQKTEVKQNNQNQGKKPKPEKKPSNPTPTAYDVTFSCNVESATLFIDGNNYGTPSGTRTLKTGKHSVKVTANGYENHSQTINVNANNRSFHFNLKKKEVPVAQGSNKTFKANGVSFTMVYVQGGTFTMGATSEQGSDAADNEKPAHSVTLSNYYIGETEVTQELWEAVMDSNPSNFTDDSRRPVEEVSWDDCQTFINKLNSLTGQRFHLPTEAQWEYAARGGSKSLHYKYSGSNTLSAVAWYEDNSDDSTHPVKTKSPNELGLYDMSGNVSEWCQDWFGSYNSGAQTNPTGPSSGACRMIRGAGWSFNARNCRVSIRRIYAPSYRDIYLGLRLAL